MAIKIFEKEIKSLSAESLRNLKRRLVNNADAMACLKGEKRGLDDNTIAHFGLGLSYPHDDKKTGIVRSDALVSPMRSPETGGFLKKLAYTPIADVTKAPIADSTWMAGYQRTYWADQLQKQIFLFICEGLKDVWRLWQELAKAGKVDDFAVISASHGTGIPDEWKDEAF